ncbi:hypothetical protein [Dyadobacter sp. CY312]|uniref:hypothetical protein n=1 Tax=Dyadobacter sp. CY312 TaxID=2907303 RepID=UPI001F40770D|nr:hypothetical protein [Dyadobacter sp. CY312]MCE7043553.1 hypothetical protein [Dyadobacter sp. CY312]
MKIKILLSCFTVIMLLSVSQVIAQTDEYYRPDTLGKEKPQRKEIPPVEKQEVVEKKKEVDFKQQPFIDRLRLGGSFGLSFGSVTNVNLSPMAGYELTEKLVAGVGLTGMYFRSKYYGINSLYYGGRGFIMYNAFPMVNLIGELEGMNVEASYQKRKWLASPLLGASYSQPIGARFIKAVHLTILYNLSYNNQIDQYSGQNLSPYSSPFVFRVTFL